MLRLSFLFLALAIMVAVRLDAAAENIVTTAGVVYTNARITRVEPDGISIAHSRGVAKLPFEILSPETQRQYSFDPTNAANYRIKSTIRRREALEATARAKEDFERAKQAELQWDAAEQQRREKVLADKREQIALQREIAATIRTVSVHISAVHESGAIVYDGKYHRRYFFIEGIPPTYRPGDKWTGSIRPAGAYSYEEYEQSFVAFSSGIPVSAPSQPSSQGAIHVISDTGPRVQASQTRVYGPSTLQKKVLPKYIVY